MIKFEHDNGELSCAVFAGDINTLLADLSVEISLLYGSLKCKKERAAKAFREGLLMSLVDPDLSKVVFSDALYKAITEAGTHISECITVDNKEEFERQLKEILEEENK